MGQYSFWKIVLLLFAVGGIVLKLIEHRQNYQFVWQVWKRFRIPMFFQSLGVIFLTVIAFVLLDQVPGVNFGWMDLFFEKGGNALTAPVLEGSQSGNVFVRLTVPVFVLVLGFMLPFLAQLEEKIFRKGHLEWGSIFKQSVKFGLVHCLVGVPLSAGFALIIPGLFYALKYKRSFERNLQTLGYQQAETEALMESTTYHTMYNMILIVFLLISTAGMVFLV